MKIKEYKKYRFLFFIFGIVLLEGCNTLYNTVNVKIEVIEPARVILPENYSTVAIKYNNANIGFNLKNSIYLTLDSLQFDSINSDSIASKIYYDLFVEKIKKQQYFDSIIKCPATDFTGISLNDSLVINNIPEFESVQLAPQMSAEEKVSFFVRLINFSKDTTMEFKKSKFIDPQLGLYSKEELKNIADSTNADALFSLDFYSSIDVIHYFPEYARGAEFVYVLALWNIYDLKKLELQAFQPKMDTITWSIHSYSPKLTVKNLPPRNDAIFNAADIAGTKFADFLIPHWIEEDRFFYHSGHIDLKKTKILVKENKWLEAAEIWKANINNPNKNIAAKSKFNMGLVCEILGDNEAALDWVVQSFHVFGPKNQEHYANCQRYIRILAQRRLESNIINKQFFVDDVYDYN